MVLEPLMGSTSSLGYKGVPMAPRRKGLVDGIRAFLAEALHAHQTESTARAERAVKAAQAADAAKAAPLRVGYGFGCLLWGTALVFVAFGVASLFSGAVGPGLGFLVVAVVVWFLSLVMRALSGDT
jgi:hypothetical protein